MEALKPDFIIVGAGPAGAAFARIMSDKGYQVVVLEAAAWPGLKPCGWAVPREVEEYLKLPSEVVLTKVKGFRVYLDGELVGEHREGLWGYIINKPGLLKILLEGLEVKYRTVARVGPQGPLHLGPLRLEARQAVVVAAGPMWEYSPRERVYCLQTCARLYEPIDPSVIEFWFESELVGYYWVFPESEHRVRLGVGGYASVEQLYSKLAQFISRHPILKHGELEEPARGAPVVVSGVDINLVEAENPAIGEAAGFVMPLTGEGIRPAIASAYALAQKFLGERRPLSLLKDLVTWIRRQRKFLDLMIKAEPRLRGEVLKSIPLDLAVDVALGKASIGSLLKLLSTVPSAVAKALSSLTGNRRNT